MAKTPSAFDESLNRAQASMSTVVLQNALRDLPGSMSMGQLIDDVGGSSYSDFFRNMSINAFIELRGGGKKAAAAGGGFNTRTQSGRDEIDAAVTRCLEAAGVAGAEQIRSEIGGSAAQIRESLTRLAQDGLVTRSGEKRATKYHWKGKGAKKK